MGQQTLLLVVLGAIVLGYAVIISMNFVAAARMNKNRDAVTSDLTTLATMAQQYHNKSKAFGGGGGSFVNWKIPSNLDTTDNGVYRIKSLQKDLLILQGVGYETGNNAKTPVKVEAVVNKNKIKISILN